jgi:hypothetical protein
VPAAACEPIAIAESLRRRQSRPQKALRVHPSAAKLASMPDAIVKLVVFSDFL